MFAIGFISISQRLINAHWTWANGPVLPASRWRVKGDDLFRLFFLRGPNLIPPVPTVVALGEVLRDLLPGGAQLHTSGSYPAGPGPAEIGVDVGKVTLTSALAFQCCLIEAL